MALNGEVVGDRWKEKGVYAVRTPEGQQEYYDKWGGDAYDKETQQG